jgi:UDP-galactopyranose mutase
MIHKYGAHIFHTSYKPIWEFVNKYAEFVPFVNSPIAVYKDDLYNLPFNMNTYTKVFGKVTPAEARKIIDDEIKGENIKYISNLEQKAISMVGKTIYERLVKGYTEKQWGKPCRELPPSIIGRLPLRFIFDNNYFNDVYQGIPQCGYTYMIAKMLNRCDLMLNTPFSFDLANKAKKVIFTGKIDEYFEYIYGRLEYRSLTFKTEKKNVGNYQGNAVFNYTDAEIPYTRIIEHKHFDRNVCELPYTFITAEYPCSHNENNEPLYPVPTESNKLVYDGYKELAKGEKKVHFVGRLGEYRYYDMDDTVMAALQLADQLL